MFEKFDKVQFGGITEQYMPKLNLPGNF